MIVEGVTTTSRNAFKSYPLWPKLTESKIIPNVETNIQVIANPYASSRIFDSLYDSAPFPIFIPWTEIRASLRSGREVVHQATSKVRFPSKVTKNVTTSTDFSMKGTMENPTNSKKVPNKPMEPLSARLCVQKKKQSVASYMWKSTVHRRSANLHSKNFGSMGSIWMSDSTCWWQGFDGTTPVNRPLTAR